MAIIHARVSDEDKIFIEKFARKKKVSVSELVRNYLLEALEDELDLEAGEKAYAEYLKNPVSYTLEEVDKHLGFA
jgi:hypothetical protein